MVPLSILGVNPRHLTDMAAKDETVNGIFSLTENNMELPKSPLNLTLLSNSRDPRKSNRIRKISGKV